jgi:hypothetical protein
MRPSGTTRRLRSCGVCGELWGGRARFCGRCGEALTTSPPAGFSASPRRRRFAVGAGACVVLVGLAAWLVSADVSLPRLGERADPTVALPEPAAVPVDRGPTSSEREAALAPFVPGRFTCEPSGCERWRRPLREWQVDPQPVGDMLAFLEVGDLLAIDVSTGEERWRTPLPRFLEAPARFRSEWGPWNPRVAASDDLIAVATEAGVLVVTREGRPLWASEVDLGEMVQHVAVTPSSVGVVSASWSDEPPEVWDDAVDEPVEEGTGALVDDSSDDDWPGPPVQLSVFDARTGEPRWTRTDLRHVSGTPSATADVFVVRSRTGAEVLDAATGDVLAEVETGQDGWVLPFQELLLVQVADGDGSGNTAKVTSTRIVDPATGAVLHEFEGYVFPLGVTAEVTILLRSLDGSPFGGPDARPPEREAIAIGRDGRLRWRLELVMDEDERCCPGVIDLRDGRVRISSAPDLPVAVVDAATGAARGSDPMAEALADDTQVQWQLGTSTLLRRNQDGTGMLIDITGRRVDLEGADWHPFWVETGPSAPVLLQADGHLIAVGFP